MRSLNQNADQHEDSITANVSDLKKFIEQDNSQAIIDWLEKNKKLDCPHNLQQPLFADEHPLYRIPVFMIIRKKKRGAFIALTSQSDFDFSMRSAACETILDVLCQAQWLEGLKLLVKCRPTILLDIQKVHGQKNLSVLHNLICYITKIPSRRAKDLLLIDQLFQLEGAQLLIDHRVLDKNFLEEVTDNTLKREIEKLIRKYPTLETPSNHQKPNLGGITDSLFSLFANITQTKSTARSTKFDDGGQKENLSELNKETELQALLEIASHS